MPPDASHRGREAMNMSDINLHGRCLLKETDLTQAEFGYLVNVGSQLRSEERAGRRGNRLAGRNTALIFEKISTRTRAAFEVAAHDEGGHVIYLSGTRQVSSVPPPSAGLVTIDPPSAPPPSSRLCTPLPPPRCR